MYLLFMNKLIFITLLFILSSCSLDKVVKHHGVNFLDKKNEKLLIESTNKNDAKKLLGPPSTVSNFDNDVWIYIERKTSVSDIKSFGRKKLLVNNLLILEFDERGLLINKIFRDKNNMNELIISKSETGVIDQKKSFFNSVITNLRHKINDPLGKRKAR